MALFIWHQLLGHPRQPDPGDSQQGSRLGPAATDAEIRAFLAECGAAFHHFGSDDEKCTRVAELLAAGHVVGWLQGRMEFGPRALGSRSILGDARDPQMQAVMNLKIKFRESFRPFAPSVLEERPRRLFRPAAGAGEPVYAAASPRYSRRAADGLRRLTPRRGSTCAR